MVQKRVQETEGRQAGEQPMQTAAQIVRQIDNARNALAGMMSQISATGANQERAAYARLASYIDEAGKAASFPPRLKEAALSLKKFDEGAGLFLKAMNLKSAFANDTNFSQPEAKKALAGSLEDVFSAIAKGSMADAGFSLEFSERLGKIFLKAQGYSLKAGAENLGNSGLQIQERMDLMLEHVLRHVSERNPRAAQEALKKYEGFAGAYFIISQRWILTGAGEGLDSLKSMGPLAQDGKKKLDNMLLAALRSLAEGDLKSAHRSLESHNESARLFFKGGQYAILTAAGEKPEDTMENLGQAASGSKIRIDNDLRTVFGLLAAGKVKDAEYSLAAYKRLAKAFFNAAQYKLTIGDGEQLDSLSKGAGAFLDGRLDLVFRHISAGNAVAAEAALKEYRNTAKAALGLLERSQLLGENKKAMDLLRSGMAALMRGDLNLAAYNLAKTRKII